MAKFFKSIKSLFIIEEDNPQSKTDASQDSKERKDNPVPRSLNVDVSGDVNQKFLNVLLGSLESNNLEGFDYLEFKESLKSLKSMDMDEATRYKSAFAMAKTMGVSKDDLIAAAEHYLGVLSKEESKFQVALENQRNRNLLQRENRIIKIDEWLVTKEKQVEKIQLEITARRKQREKIQTELSQAASKVEKTRNDFVITFQYLVKQIQSDIEKLKSYLS